MEDNTQGTEIHLEETQKPLDTESKGSNVDNNNEKNNGTSTATGESIGNESTKKELGLQSRVRWMTSKREFRVRAHSNPLNDGLFNPPKDASSFDLSKYYPHLNDDNQNNHHVNWCDIGCGYGGLLASLSMIYPEKIMLGLEIRDRVTEFCRQRVIQLRKEYPNDYMNINFERTNAMKFLPYYFKKSSLEKLFFCYPDPHFKKRKNRQRIISSQLLDEYAYVLIPNVGILYIATDVEELFIWMKSKLLNHVLFQQRSNHVHQNDTITHFISDMTDEAQRVEKSDRQKYHASFIRISNPIN